MRSILNPKHWKWYVAAADAAFHAKGVDFQKVNSRKLHRSDPVLVCLQIIFVIVFISLQ